MADHQSLCARYRSIRDGWPELPFGVRVAGMSHQHFSWWRESMPMRSPEQVRCVVTYCTFFDPLVAVIEFDAASEQRFNEIMESADLL